MSAVRIRHSPLKSTAFAVLFLFIEAYAMFYTYIIYTPAKDRFYIGASENPSERLKKHNAKNKGFTQQAADWKIVYQKEFPSKSEALKHEKQIKDWKSKVMIQKLISSERPD